MNFFCAIVIQLVIMTPLFMLPVRAQYTDALRYVTPPAPQFTDAERQSELARRRRAVINKMKDKSVLILFSAEPKVYAGDVDFMYRQENNLYYLTNLKQNGAALILTKTGNDTQEILFLPKPNPESETWNGKMYTNDDAQRISGLKNIFNRDDFDAFLQNFKTGKPFATKEGENINISAVNLYLLLPAFPFDDDGQREYRRETEFVKDFAKTSIDPATNNYKYESTLGCKIENARQIFASLRLIKSPYEIKLLQHAVDITTEAHERAWATIGNAQWEYQVQAEVEYTFRRRNADYWGYPSIVGSGANATTIHYEESQSPVKPGNLLLMDVGAEYEHYSADVTRTFPVNGKFSKIQADIYQIVYNAQEAAAKEIKPGADEDAPSDAAEEVLKNGLTKLGLITAPDAFIPSTEKELINSKGEKEIIGVPQYTLWYMHGWGHWLGMNVHDVGDTDKFAEGMVTTNEPGIYIREDALNYLPDTTENKAFIEKIRPAYEKYKNIGVRIEDDMLVTKTGVVWMTKNLPRKMSDIEAMMAKNKN